MKYLLLTLGLSLTFTGWYFFSFQDTANSNLDKKNIVIPDITKQELTKISDKKVIFKQEKNTLVNKIDDSETILSLELIESRAPMPQSFWKESEQARSFWKDKVDDDSKLQAAYIEIDGAWLKKLEVGESFPVKLPFSDKEYTAEVTDIKKYSNGATSIKSKFLELEPGFTSRVTLENENGLAYFATPEGMFNVQINNGFGRVVTQRSIDVAYPEAILEESIQPRYEHGGIKVDGEDNADVVLP